MIKINFLMNEENELYGFKISGHAGYASAGKDIVCSAVSILGINAVNSIETLCEDGFVVDRNDEKGLLRLELKDRPSKEALLLLDSFKLGIDLIHDSYGDKYIRIES